jgi:ornithine carbamoyltransferase
VNALSDLWHPTQILADILTMYEVETSAKDHPFSDYTIDLQRPEDHAVMTVANLDPFAVLKGKKIVWVGDVNNVLNDMLVSLPRIGMTMAVAAPKGYDKVDDRVWKRV